jgi:hypothetical protein
VHETGPSVAFLTRDVVIGLADHAHPDAVLAVASAHGFDVVRELPVGHRLYQLRTDEMPTPAVLARMHALAEAPEVRWAEPSLVVAGGAEAPSSAERAPRDPADARLVRLDVAQALLDGLRVAHGASAPVMAVVASHGVDVWTAGACVQHRREALGSDCDLVDLLASFTGASRAADVVVVLPALGASLPLSNVLRAALETLERHGRDGRGTVVLTPQVLGDVEAPRVAALDQPLAMHAAVVVINATSLDAHGSETRAPGVGGGMHVTACAPARQPPAAAAPTAATLLVADVVLTMLTANPALSAADVRRVLRATAERIDPAQEDSDGAWLDARGARAQADGTLPVFSRWYGYGRVDAVRAVLAARSRRPLDQEVPRPPISADRPAAPRGSEWRAPHDVAIGGGYGMDAATAVG